MMGGEWGFGGNRVGGGGGQWQASWVGERGRELGSVLFCAGCGVVAGTIWCGYGNDMAPCTAAAWCSSNQARSSLLAPNCWTALAQTGLLLLLLGVSTPMPSHVMSSNLCPVCPIQLLPFLDACWLRLHFDTLARRLHHALCPVCTSSSPGRFSSVSAAAGMMGGALLLCPGR